MADNPRTPRTPRKAPGESLTNRLERVALEGETTRTDLNILRAEHAATKVHVLKVDRKLTELTSHVKTHQGELFDPKVKGGHVRNTKGVESAHKRITAQQKEIDTLKKDLHALKANPELLKGALDASNQPGIGGGPRAFVGYLRDHNVSDDELRDVLGIVAPDGELNLNDAELLFEWLSDYTRQMRATKERLDEHGTRLNQVETNLRELTYNQVGFGREFEEYREDTNRRIDERIVEVTSTATPWWVYVVALGVGVLTWIIASFVFGGSVVHGSTYDAHNAVVGSFQLGWHDSWRAFFIAVAMGGIALVLLSGITARTTRRQRVHQHHELQHENNQHDEPAPQPAPRNNPQRENAAH